MLTVFYMTLKIIILVGRDESQQSMKCQMQLFEMTILRPGANTEVSFFFFPLNCRIWGLKFGLWKSESVGV